jgi:hypothetical protein
MGPLPLLIAGAISRKFGLGLIDIWYRWIKNKYRSNEASQETVVLYENGF